jgi:Flp pilus assembly protein CpaB
LLEAVTVLATGRSQRALPGVGIAPAGVFEEAGFAADYSTITLDVTPEQAQLLAVGLRIGELVPLLRPEGDEKRSPPAVAGASGRTACNAATLGEPVMAPARRSGRASTASLELLVGGSGSPALSKHFFAEP